MKKKSIMALLTATAMVCSAGADCVSVMAAESEDQVLSMMSYIDGESGDPIQEAVAQVYEQFTEDTGIDIDLNIVPWDQCESKLVITNQAGSPPDVALISSQKLASLVNSGVLMDMDEFIERDWNKEDYSNAVWNAGTYAGDGKVYCIINSAHTRGLWYNTDYVEKAPETWDEVVEISQKVMEENEGVYGFGFWGGKHYASVEATIGPLTWAGDGAMVNDDGSACWANESVADAIKFMSDCVNEYKISPEACIYTTDYTDISNMFMSGNIAMYLDGSYAEPGIRATVGDEEMAKFKFAPYPAKEEGGSRPHFANGWAWVIPRNAKNPELAWEFINWYCQKDIQLRNAKAEGGIPINVEAQSDEAFSDELHQLFMENLNTHGRSNDPFVYYQEAEEEISIAAATYCLDPTTDLENLLQESQKSFNEKYYGE